MRKASKAIHQRSSFRVIWSQDSRGMANSQELYRCRSMVDSTFQIVPLEYCALESWEHAVADAYDDSYNDTLKSADSALRAQLNHRPEHDGDGCGLSNGRWRSFNHRPDDKNVNADGHQRVPHRDVP